MGRTLIVGNWKENKTAEEARIWLEVFASALDRCPPLSLEVVLCPSFPLLPRLKEALAGRSWPLALFELGAQDVSQFEKGSYTGEVSAAQLSGLAAYVILGHSERERFFGEGPAQVERKLRLCFKYNLVPVLCASGLERLKLSLGDIGERRNLIVVYEPPAAISVGGRFHPEKPEAVAGAVARLRAFLGEGPKILYGGSVSSKTVGDFLARGNIDGVLVGAASLDPREFAKLIAAAER